MSRHAKDSQAQCNRADTDAQPQRMSGEHLVVLCAGCVRSRQGCRPAHA